MLSERQRRYCAEIAQSLDAGNLTLWREAEPSLSAAERALIWDLRRQPVAHWKLLRGEYRQQREARVITSGILPMGNRNDFPATRPPRVETDFASSDLDYWADEPSSPVLPYDDDNDVAPEQKTKLCPICAGKGRDHSGRSCANCGGSGRVPIDDVPDDDDYDNFGKKSYGYEFEEE